MLFNAHVGAWGVPGGLRGGIRPKLQGSLPLLQSYFLIFAVGFSLKIEGQQSRGLRMSDSLRRHPKGRSVSEWISNYWNLSSNSSNSKSLARPRAVRRARVLNLPGPPNSIQKSIKILMSFWSRFWCLLGPFWPPKTTPFGDPDRPKIVPRRVLTPLLFEKVDFSKNERRCSHSTILTPKTAQDAAKIGSRSSQDGLKSDLKRDRFSR